MLNFDLADQYWPELTATVRPLYTGTEIRDPAAVVEVLRASFRYLEGKFMALIAAETRASFYLAVHRYHESATALWVQQLSGKTLPVNRSDFAGVRRVLKLILEQGCANDLQNSVNYNQDVQANASAYLNTIDHLLYLGYWANNVAGFISRAQLFPEAIGIRFDEEGVDFVIHEPFATVLHYVDQDYYRHQDDVVLHDTITDLKQVFHQEAGIDYDEVTGWLPTLPKDLGLLNPELLFEELTKRGYDREHLTSFFAGLTVSRTNKMSFEDCIIRNQDINRYTYRPILSVQVEGVECWLVGLNKWQESMVTMTTNALPFGVFPSEWKAYQPVARFINKVKGEHDKTLEKPLADILKARGFVFEANVKSIHNISLVVKDVGEIDLLYIDPVQRVLYVCECKHNRSKFDAAGWRRDYSGFVRDYESQLANKVHWVADHMADVAKHFSRKEKLPIDLTGYAVAGIFVINAPTVYLYDGAFPTFTISMFRKLIDGSFQEHQISYTSPVSNQSHLIGRPYMKNAALLFTELASGATPSA
jgi:hypothetical protein